MKPLCPFCNNELEEEPEREGWFFCLVPDCACEDRGMNLRQSKPRKWIEFKRKKVQRIKEKKEQKQKLTLNP